MHASEERERALLLAFYQEQNGKKDHLIPLNMGLWRLVALQINALIIDL